MTTSVEVIIRDGDHERRMHFANVHDIQAHAPEGAATFMIGWKYGAAEGCCSACRGQGATLAGPCHDCYGSGHAHAPDQSCGPGRTS